MITPCRIAVAGACAMAVSVVVTNGILQIAGPASPAASRSEWLASTIAGALGIGLLVWVGMYFGARFSPPHQRNGRLVWLAVIGTRLRNNHACACGSVRVKSCLTSGSSSCALRTRLTNSYAVCSPQSALLDQVTPMEIEVRAIPDGEEHESACSCCGRPIYAGAGELHTGTRVIAARMDSENIVYSVLAPEDAPWSDFGAYGQVVDRGRALEASESTGLFNIVDATSANEHRLSSRILVPGASRLEP